jgi:hypothetical protein
MQTRQGFRASRSFRLSRSKSRFASLVEENRARNRVAALDHPASTRCQVHFIVPFSGEFEAWLAIADDHEQRQHAGLAPTTKHSPVEDHQEAVENRAIGVEQFIEKNQSSFGQYTFRVSSDRFATDAPTARPPKARLSDSIAVWTGDNWSAVMTEAMTFVTLDDADEYVRANFSKVAGQFSPAKPNIKRPVESVLPSPPMAEP